MDLFGKQQIYLYQVHNQINNHSIFLNYNLFLLFEIHFTKQHPFLLKVPPFFFYDFPDVPFKSGCYSVSQQKWDENEHVNGTFIKIKSDSISSDSSIFSYFSLPSLLASERLKNYILNVRPV